MKTTLCAFDLSLTGTAYARDVPEYSVDQDPNSAVEISSLIPPKDLIGMPRLDWILGACARQVRATDLVILEDFSFGSRSRSLFDIAGLGMLVRWWLHKRGIPYIAVAPARLKKFVTGKGNAEKNVMLREVYRRWDFEAANDNEADAFALLKLGEALLFGGELTKAQTEVVDQIRKTHHALLKSVM